MYGLSANSYDAVPEEAALKPANIYAVTKAAAELALAEIAMRGLKLVRLRPFNHTGPAQSDRFVVPRIVNQVARVKLGLQPPVLRLGATDRARDFLDVQDVCDAYVAAMDRFDQVEPLETLNIASGVARTIGSIVEDVISVAEVACEVQSEATALRPFEVVRVCGDASRARRELSWEPRVLWGKTLERMFAAEISRLRARG